ncbi:MAG: hypothetical protein VX589_15265 [Myxococcota bacterium]|nr:hypothetical protein [Myxococcota bacterium]
MAARNLSTPENVWGYVPFLLRYRTQLVQLRELIAVLDTRLTRAAMRRDAALNRLGARVLDEPDACLEAKVIERFKNTLQSIDERQDRNCQELEVIERDLTTLDESHASENAVSQAKLEALKLEIVAVERRLRTELANVEPESSHEHLELANMRLELTDQMEDALNQDSIRRAQQVDAVQQVKERRAEARQGAERIASRRMSVLQDLGREVLRSAHVEDLVDGGDEVFAELRDIKALSEARERIDQVRRDLDARPFRRALLIIIFMGLVAMLGALYVIL